MYFESLTQFDHLIELGEQLLSNIQSTEQPREEQERYRFEKHVLEAKDMLCYLNFSAGKAARQNGNSFRADIYLQKASDYLLQSALTLTEITKSRMPAADRIKLAHSKLTRIGVVEVARAWNFVFQGAIEAAAASADRAMKLVAKADKQNKMLAQSILGIVERTKAGKEAALLNAAIAKLQGSYEFFLDEMPTPRYAVRCLCELEVAYVIADKLDEALKTLKGFAEYLKPGHPSVFRFEKITRQPRWSGQLRLVKSRLARKAAEKLSAEDLSRFITALDEILARSRPRRTGSPEAQALQLALGEAEDAESCSDRGVHMDAMVCSGEALMAMGKEDLAKKVFLRLLHENGVGSDASSGRAADREQFQAELRKVKEEPHVVVLPMIYLAQVAMTHWELDLVGFYLEQSKTLLRPEHAWLENLWQKTQTRFRNLVEDKLVVDLKNHRGLRDLETRFRASLEKKFQLLSRPINDLKEEFHTDDYTIKRLRKKIRQEKGIKRIRRPKRNGGKKQDHPN
jgi:tetratricopeptide (TPR) repeat protein